MDGKPKRKKGKFQFSLLSLMMFTTLIGLVLAYYINRAKRAERRQRLREYVVSILQGANRHEAVREHPLLRELQIIPAGSRLSAGFQNPRKFVIARHSSLSMQSVEKRSDWPIEKIRQAVLSGLVEVVADADLLTSAKMDVTARRAVLTGDEGQITWGVISIGKKNDLPYNRPWNCRERMIVSRRCNLESCYLFVHPRTV